MEIFSFGNSFSFLEVSTLGNYFCWTKANLKKFLKGKNSLEKILKFTIYLEKNSLGKNFN